MYRGPISLHHNTNSKFARLTTAARAPSSSCAKRLHLFVDLPEFTKHSSVSHGGYADCAILALHIIHKISGGLLWGGRMRRARQSSSTSKMSQARTATTKYHPEEIRSSSQEGHLPRFIVVNFEELHAVPNAPEQHLPQCPSGVGRLSFRDDDADGLPAKGGFAAPWPALSLLQSHVQGFLRRHRFIRA